MQLLFLCIHTSTVGINVTIIVIYYAHIGDYTDQCQDSASLFSIKNQKMGISLFSNGDTFLVIKSKNFTVVIFFIQACSPLVIYYFSRNNEVFAHHPSGRCVISGRNLQGFKSLAITGCNGNALFYNVTVYACLFPCSSLSLSPFPSLPLSLPFPPSLSLSLSLPPSPSLLAFDDGTEQNAYCLTGINKPAVFNSGLVFGQPVWNTQGAAYYFPNPLQSPGSSNQYPRTTNLENIDQYFGKI